MPGQKIVRHHHSLTYFSLRKSIQFINTTNVKYVYCAAVLRSLHMVENYKLIHFIRNFLVSHDDDLNKMDFSDCWLSPFQPHAGHGTADSLILGGLFS